MRAQSTVDRALFIGFALPPELFENVLRTDRGMPAQTQRFGWAVIHALQATGYDVSVVSVEPVADFPNNRRILIGRHRFQHDLAAGVSAPFVNLTGVKHVTRFTAAALLGLHSARREPPAVVVVHGANSALLWAGLRIGRRAQCPVIAILTDAPGLRTRYDTKLSMALKRLDSSIISAALSRLSGVIALSRSISDDLAPASPTMVMEGIAEPPTSRPPTRVALGRPVVIYAGGLHESYGVLSLVEAVGHSNGEWSLDVYGRGPVEEQVRAAAVANPRIRYRGLASSKELAEAYSAAALLVNPRPINVNFGNHSFPSKLLEYMASGTPTMTTRLPNLPADYLKHLVVSEDDPVSMAASIDGFLMELEQTRQAFGRSSRDFILTTRGAAAQGARIRGFIESLGRSHGDGPGR